MLNYFIRRLLLVPVTFIAITFMVYAIVRSAPGGPIQQLERQLQSAGGEAGGGGGLIDSGDMALSEDAKDELRQYYNLDKSIFVGYLEWLGVKPRTVRSSIGIDQREAEPAFWTRAYELQRSYDQAQDGLEAKAREKDWQLEGENDFLVPIGKDRRSREPDFFSKADELAAAGVERLSDLSEHLEERGYERIGSKIYGPLTELEKIASPEYFREISALVETRNDAKQRLDEYLDARSRVYQNDNFYDVDRRFGGILQGDFGRSTQKSKPALEVITDRFPVSVYFGLIGYIATWLVCVPLGVLKAIRHKSWFDTITSVIVFFGYAIPGFIAALILIIALTGEINILPAGNFQSDNWDEMWAAGNYWWCIKDRVEHTIIPMIGYMVGSFATMTVLMKNSLLENLGADYVRTAFAKGLSERRVIFLHALRNSLIPITATIGYALGILFAGSFLIEQTCNINGMGKLGIDSIQQRDYPVIMGILVFGVLIRLVGNIISDLTWALIDPRIRFK